MRIDALQRRGSAAITSIAGAVFATLMLASAAVAHADPDTDFANQLHTVGVYGPKDYNAWIAKISCERLDRGVDHNAYDSAQFVSRQLSKNATTAQAWQFVALAYPLYCPDKQDLLQQVADTSEQ
ncbi:DUF732 domain-containing protein [Mycolicibacterium helvum]|uniref:DUF732 domain-containing protein n=1 Tax=Mycolicibacterium helvum TaxID=1534349 RepID=A0A7I7T912_9MYCO|nr:DUF732 domain-containing protein [Mycolicibacterium helvum]BBY65253.1 hypothetical protein MHEL_34960 [Mycolicibacterium helvum]